MPAHGFNDYRGLDVRGRIVVVLSGTPAGIPSDVAAHLNGDKRRMAAARGAVGLITIRTRADSAATPWARAARGGGRPLTTWVEPGGAPFSDSAGLRFTASVDDSAARALFQTAPRPLDAVLDDAACRAGSRAASRCTAPPASPARPARRAASQVRTCSASCPGPIPRWPINMCC